MEKIQIIINRISKSRTLIFNILCTLFTVAEANLDIAKTLIHPEFQSYFILFVAFVNMYLRTITTESLKEKDAKEVK